MSQPCDYELPIIDYDCGSTPDMLRVAISDIYGRTTATFETDGVDWWHILPSGEKVKAERPEAINAALAPRRK
jgi:uncharacterized protein YgfB (UPF0149 family)